MDLSDLEFKSEDFVEVMDILRNSPKTPFVYQEIVYIAERANQLLKQRLSKGQIEKEPPRRTTCYESLSPLEDPKS